MILYRCFILIFLFPLVALAEGALTLDMAIKAGLQKNLDLQISKSEQLSFEGRRSQAGAIPNPEIEVESTGFTKTHENGLKNLGEFSVLLKQPIELGGKRSKRIELAELESTRAKADLKAKRLEVIFRVKQSFYETLAAYERAKLSKERASLASKLSSVTIARFKAGKISQLEQTRSLSNSSMALLSADRNARQAETKKRHLAFLIGEERPSFDTLEGGFYKIQKLASFGELEAELKKSPYWVRHEAEHSAARAELAVEDSKRFPDMEIQGGIKRPFDDEKIGYVVGVSIPLPLFDRNQGGVSTALSKSEVSLFSRQQNEQTLKLELKDNYDKYESTFKQISELEAGVLPSVRETLNAISSAYEQGRFSYLEVLDAEASLFEIRDQHIGLLEEYWTIRASLERFLEKNI